MTDDIQKLKHHLIDGMVRYMKFGGAKNETDPSYDPGFDAGYSQAHINRCCEIIDAFLSEISATPIDHKNPFIMEAVKKAVLDLNQLNDESDGNMIETDQREDLCEIIITAANNAGLVSDQYDITDEWREW